MMAFLALYMFPGASMVLVERKLQLAIDSTSRWAELRGFRLTASKTVTMHFCICCAFLVPV